MFRKLRAWIYRKDKHRCSYCGKVLNEVEEYYYINSCEDCERRMQEKLKDV